MFVRKVTLVFMIYMTIFLVAPVQPKALSVFFNPSPINVVEGDSFTIDLLSNIGQNEQILGFDIDLLFDDSQLRFTGATIGGDWNAPSMPVPDDDVSIAGLGFFGFPPGTGVWGDNTLLATLSFDCLAIGSSLLDIGTDDIFEGFQLASMPGFASYSSTTANIHQAPVPEPTTIFLLSTGLVGLAGLGRKKLIR